MFKISHVCTLCQLNAETATLGKVGVSVSYRVIYEGVPVPKEVFGIFTYGQNVIPSIGLFNVRFMCLVSPYNQKSNKIMHEIPTDKTLALS